MIDIQAEFDKFGIIPISRYEAIKRLPSGSLILDAAIGGGYPRSRISFISGPEGSGKSTLMMVAAIRTKEDGGKVAVIDTEGHFNVELAQRSGLGTPGDGYYLFRPQYAEMAFETVRILVGHVDLIILDSFSASPVKAELDGTMEDNQMAAFARVATKFFRKVTPLLENSNTTLLMTGQLRTGFGSGFSYTVKSGGKARGYYPVLDITLSKHVAAYMNDVQIGMDINGTVDKNNYGPAYRKFTTEVQFVPRLLVNYVSELLDLARDHCVLTKEDGSQIKSTSATYYHGETKLGVGKKAAAATIIGDRDLLQNIEDEVREIISNPNHVLGKETK